MAKLNGVEWDEEEWQRRRERELERESMDRQGEAMAIRLSRLGLAGAILSEHEIERLQAEVARLREALNNAADAMMARQPELRQKALLEAEAAIREAAAE